MKRILSVLIFSLIMCFAVKAAGQTVFLGFDDNAVPQGASPNFAYTIENGIMSADLSTSDPYITYSCDINADDYSEVRIRMKHDLVERTDKKTPIFQYYYQGIAADGTALTLSEVNSSKVTITLSSDGEYAVYSVPIDHTKLSGATLTSLRFDIVNCPGEFSIDYIMLVPENQNPDIIFEFDEDGNKEGWGYLNLVSGLSAENGVLSGTTSSTSGLITKVFDSPKEGAAYDKLYVRMMADNLTDNANTLLYTNLKDQDGTLLKSWSKNYVDENGNAYQFVASSVAKANNGTYKLYTYDLSKKVPYVNNYFTDVYLNVVNKASVDFSIDYIIYKNKISYEWTFDHEGFNEGWMGNTASFGNEKGQIVYTAPESYENPYITLSGLSVDAGNYDGIEIIMKHNLVEDGDKAAASGTTVQLYYHGKDLDGNDIAWSEANSAKAEVKTSSSGDSYVCYYINLKDKASWSGTMDSLRIDPLNSNGDFSIDYIRLVPGENLSLKPLDESKITLDYEFEDSMSGTADGRIVLDFDGQDYKNAKRITFSWANGNDTDGYKALENYLSIRTFAGSDFDGTYTINKNMVIPEEATALIVEIADVKKTFEKVYVIPQDKLCKITEEPLYTVGLISDVHVGGWGSETVPNARLVAARSQLSELADFVVINGDVTQWYGAYSGEEFKAYNYNGSIYADNGIRTDEHFGIGNSQWTVLDSYLKGFGVPVYVVQGNHDVRDSNGWSPMIESEKYWKPFLSSWIDYSNAAENSHKYINSVTYDEIENYYDTVVNGHHYIFLSIPKTTEPTYSFGEKQLAWLDKKLYENEETGKPIFVFGHVPLETDLSGGYWDDQIGDDAQIKAILAKHPTAIYVSGHTHYSLNVDFLSSIDGQQTTTSYIHDGGTTTVNTPDDEKNPDKTTEVQQSHGVVAEVYSDKIILRGRDFVNGKWISRGRTYLTLKEKSDIPEISVSRTVNSDGSGNVSVADLGASYTCQIFVDGAETAGYTANVPEDADYVAVRITADDGSYVSKVFEDISEIPVESTTVEIQGENVVIKDLNAEANLMLASYYKKQLIDIKIIPVTSDTSITLEETGLKTDSADTVKAFLLAKDTYAPLCENVTK